MSLEGELPARPALREHILAVASGLFYELGVRAVGVDLVVERAGVAKTSLYRYFRTKDDLIAAYLEREDKEFWQTWDAVTAAHAHDAQAELMAQLAWIGERVGRSKYRGCPQINVAAEYPDLDHPARSVALAHKREMRLRLRSVALRLGACRPDELAGQLAVLINGAFVSSGMLDSEEAVPLLQSAAKAMIWKKIPISVDQVASKIERKRYIAGYRIKYSKIN